jgi:formate hydrogenlyase subunit 4
MTSGLASLALLLILAPLLVGVASRTKAILTGRRGSPVWQLYADLRKLSGRGVVYSVTTTWVFRLAPAAVVAATLVAALLVPLDGQSALVRFSGDAVAFAYAFGLGRFLLVLGALDTGSSFEGMGASREVTFASLVELGLFVSFAGLSLTTGDLTLTGMFGVPLAERWGAAAPALVMIAASLFALLLAECARVPVDDPATHLELTMIHEVMVLDHSGPDLALILYASSLKFALLGALVVRVLVPSAGLSVGANVGVLVLGLLGIGVAVGVVESTMARLRLPRVPLYIAGGSALGTFGLVLLLR